MCSESKKTSARGPGMLRKITCYFVICLAVCVHHSHQQNNLHQDKNKDQNGLNEHHSKSNATLPIIPKANDLDDHAGRKGRPETLNVWLFSFLSVIAIALCEVFAVLVVPIMQRVFYQHIIQFLIALAIGSLLGDATLHLIPHALLYDFHNHGTEIHKDHDMHLDEFDDNHNVRNQDHHSNSLGSNGQIDTHELHQKAVWLGFVVMLSLMLFFSFERIVNKLGEWREKRKRESYNKKKIQMASTRNSVDQTGDARPSNTQDNKIVIDQDEKFYGAKDSVAQITSNPDTKNIKVIRSGHRPTCDMVVGERVCKHRYSSICVDDIEEIMNEDMTNCPTQNEGCSLITAANNNDSNPYNTVNCGKLSSCLDRKNTIATETVPEKPESENDITANEFIKDDPFDICDKPIKGEQKYHCNVQGNENNESKCDIAAEENFAEKIMKAKRIFMNSSPIKAGTPSETPLVTKLNAVDNDLEINDGIVRGVLSSANSQTPFLLPKSNSSSSQTYKIPNNKETHHDVHEDLQHKAAIVENLAIKENGEYKTVYVNEHEHFHHGHSHAHTHLHSAPDSISSVAWMVLLGDGIHSLADGLAIGAAFSESMTSGLSTALAVLCHELPHVVGDFAMLLRAGMSSKQAIVYKFLSSVLALVGMVIGILLGELETVIPWILAATAGIFIYVALVDMMPELNSGHRHPISDHAQHDSHLKELCFQLIGMSLGTSIMLVIALYEDRLGNLISGTS